MLKLREKENNLRKKVVKNNNKCKKAEIEGRLNHYFKELTSNIIGEPFAIVFSEDSDEDDFPVKIIGMNGKPGTGINLKLDRATYTILRNFYIIFT